MIFLKVINKRRDYIAFALIGTVKQGSLAKEHAQDPKCKYFHFYSFARRGYNTATALK